MHRLERQRDAERRGQWFKFAERVAQQPAGVGAGVTVAGAAVDNQRAGAHGRGEFDRFGRILDAFAKTAPLAASESAGPQQIGNRQPALAQQLDPLLLAIVRQLLPPHANRREAGCRIADNIFFERPAISCHLVHR